MIFIVGCIFLKPFLKTVLSKLDEYKKSKWLVMKWLACVHTGDCKALICQVGYFIKLLLMRSPDNITVTCIATSGNDVWHLQPTSPASIGNRVPKTCYLFYNMSLADYIEASDTDGKHHTITNSLSNANNSNTCMWWLYNKDEYGIQYYGLQNVTCYQNDDMLVCTGDNSKFTVKLYTADLIAIPSMKCQETCIV